MMSRIFLKLLSFSLLGGFSSASAGFVPSISNATCLVAAKAIESDKQVVSSSAKINFLPEDFRAGDILATGTLDRSRVSSHNAHLRNIRALSPEQKPRLRTNGFQQVNFRGSKLYSTILAMEGSPTYFNEGKKNEEIHLRNGIADFIESQRSVLGLEFDRAIALDTVYRNSDAKAGNAFKPVELAHIDFTGSWKDIFSQFSDQWTGAIEDRLGIDAGREVMARLDDFAVEMVHIWLPIVDNTAGNTLALLDIQTLGEEARTVYGAVRRNGEVFSAVGVKASTAQDWYYSNHLAVGDAYVFLSRSTPHTAVEVSTGGEPRKSIESRLLLIRDMAK